MKELWHNFAVPHRICMLGTRVVNAKRLAIRGLHYGQDLATGVVPLLIGVWRLRHAAARLMGAKHREDAHMLAACEKVEDL